jgi:hypothetical protein
MAPQLSGATIALAILADGFANLLPPVADQRAPAAPRPVGA